MGPLEVRQPRIAVEREGVEDHPEGLRHRQPDRTGLRRGNRGGEAAGKAGRAGHLRRCDERPAREPARARGAERAPLHGDRGRFRRAWPHRVPEERPALPWVGRNQSIGTTVHRWWSYRPLNASEAAASPRSGSGGGLAAGRIRRVRAPARAPAPPAGGNAPVQSWNPSAFSSRFSVSIGLGGSSARREAWRGAVPRAGGASARSVAARPDRRAITSGAAGASARSMAANRTRPAGRWPPAFHEMLCSLRLQDRCPRSIPAPAPGAGGCATSKGTSPGA